MVPSVGNVVLLDNGKIGIVYSLIYSLADFSVFSEDENIIGIEGIDFDGHYWKSNNLNLKILAISVDSYNEQNSIFHHPV